jgi:hypothetical protein
MTYLVRWSERLGVNEELNEVWREAFPGERLLDEPAQADVPPTNPLES